MRNILILFFLFLCSALLPVAAQEPFGSVEGTVLDTQGAVVQNSTVTVRNLATNVTKTAITNENGQYRILQLQPGFYEVRASGTNFKQSVRESVQVQVGQNASVDFSLEVGGVSETV